MCQLFINALHFFLKCTLESARLYEMCTFQGTFPLLQPLNNLLFLPFPSFPFGQMACLSVG